MQHIMPMNRNIRVRRIVMLGGWVRSRYQTRLLRMVMRRFRVIRRMGRVCWDIGVHEDEQDQLQLAEEEGEEESEEAEAEEEGWPDTDDGF